MSGKPHFSKLPEEEESTPVNGDHIINPEDVDGENILLKMVVLSAELHYFCFILCLLCTSGSRFVSPPRVFSYYGISI